MSPALCLLLACLPLLTAAGAAPAQDEPLPPTLAATGFFEAVKQPFSPQYPLWSDGAVKRRWLALPPGAAIDGSQPDAWRFPPGTRLWKEFAHDGRPVETRFIERRVDGSWRYASYVWSADGREATLAPAAGIPDLPAPGAPGGRYAVPAREDCRACHEGAAVPVLGVGALQLSPDRDPLATHGPPRAADEVDLPGLVRRGWLRGIPATMLDHPPRIAADSPRERAALGYLHANCGHCHNDGAGRAPVRLQLAQSAADPAGSAQRVLRSMVDAPSRYRPPATTGEPRVVVAGRAQDSVLSLRMHSRQPRMQMPPLGTTVPDDLGLALVDAWIHHDLLERKEHQP